MATVSTYLNFSRNTEEAFLFYKSVFGGEFSGGGIAGLATSRHRKAGLRFLMLTEPDHT